MKKHLFALSAAMSVALVSTPAQAVEYLYAGSWEVDDGPNWTSGPAAYTGQEAAALLFGGVASDYAISTIDNLVANIDNLAWVSTWGGACDGEFPCGTRVAENFKISTGGNYENLGDTSAYVSDWAVGSQFTNYAFLIRDSRAGGAVPEPGTWMLLLLGFGAIGFGMRDRNARQNVAVSYA